MAASTFEHIIEELTEIKCPVGGYCTCYHWYEREDLRSHIMAEHPDETADPEYWFEQEAEKIYEERKYETNIWRMNQGLRPIGERHYA